MRWFVRLGIIGMCLLLWVGLWCGASAIAIGVTAAPVRNPFCFPDFLPGADMYAWSLTQDSQCRTALLVQNISQHPLADVMILFRADGKELRFEADYIPSGQRVFIVEKQETPFDDWNTVAFLSYTAREIEISALPDNLCADKEDYSCK